MFRIRLKESARFELPTFTEQEMRGVGDYLKELNLARWDRALNVEDQRAKSLQVTRRKPGSAPRGYAIQKQRRVGRNVRDWKLTGAMRAALGVLEAAPGRVSVGWSDVQMYLRAVFNQAIEPMFGVSPNDEKALLARFQELLDRKLRKAA